MALQKKTRIAIGLPLIFVGIMLIGATCDEQVNLQGGFLDLAPARVTGVSVPQANQVLITASGRIKGKPFTLPDPERVAVDISNVSAKDLPSEVSGMGVITRVEIKYLPDLNPPVVRVIAHVSQQVTYNLDHQGKSLALILTPKDISSDPAWVDAETKSTTTGPGTEGELPYEDTKRELERLLSGAPPDPIATTGPVYIAPVDSSPGGPVGPTKAAGAPLLPSMPASNAGAATMVGDILYRTMVPDEGMQIMILTNGLVNNYSDFDTKSPARIVVDLYGLSSNTPKNTYPIRWLGIRNVRVKTDSAKTRVTINFSGRLKAYDVKRTGSGVVVSIYKTKPAAGAYTYQSYTTGSGDNLRTISERFYGNQEGWPRLLAANEDLFTAGEIKQIRKDKGASTLGENLTIKVPAR